MTAQSSPMHETDPNTPLTIAHMAAAAGPLRHLSPRIEPRA